MPRSLGDLIAYAVSMLEPSSDRLLPPAAILDPTLPPLDPACAIRIGTSRDGRPLAGYRFGRGSRHVSLIAGCHADEPVGPATLDRLAAFLATRSEADPLLERFSWWLVPHVHPDGEARNAAWTKALGPPGGWTRDARGVDLPRYLRHVVRDLPGDDIEFGFPTADADGRLIDVADPTAPPMRPENRAVAEFLADGAPLQVHGSLHGMAFAAGPWFLLDAAWAERSASLRTRLVEAVETAGYRVHDIDRGGDKGFRRLGRGFTTRPDSRAMREHFLTAGDPATAALFRPSSMELARSLGGDPLTLVSEMPLFLLP
ncbi:MAG: M14 family zinc carboxypeptidase, partial [Acidobacteriota bacterium]